MPAVPIRRSAEEIDLSPRRFYTTTVAGSPALAAETIIATITVAANIAVVQSVRLQGWAAFTVGASGTAAQLRIRQTNVAGTVKADSGATTVVAANLREASVQGDDTAATVPGQVYVLTLQITAGAATSTVSAVYLEALVY
jgi:hypothetical protein